MDARVAGPPSPANPATARPGRQRLAVLAASAAALLCGIMAVAALLLRATLAPPPAPIVTDPDTLVRPAAVPAGFALLALAGYPTPQLVEQAIAIGAPAAALPVLLADGTLPPRDLADALLRAAEAERASDAPHAASLARLAADVARLAPALDDGERVRLLSAAGMLLHASGYPADADAEWHQASIVLRTSPAISAAARTTTATLLAQALDAAGQRERAATARALAAPGATTAIEPPAHAAPATAPLPSRPDALTQATAQRQQTALAAAQAVASGSFVDYEPLLQALAREAAEERAWTDAMLAARLPLAEQAAVIEAHIRWLLLEQFIARGVVDRDAFLRWEGRRPAIDNDLAEAWRALDHVRAQQIVALPTVAQVNQAQRDWLATRLLAARLRHDPTVDRAALWAALGPLNNDALTTQLRLVQRGDGADARPWRVPPAFTEHGLPPP